MSISTSNVKIYLTVISLWLTTQCNFQYENYMAMILILTFGILHGANDINLIERNYFLKKNKKILILKYLITMLLCFSLFFISQKIMTLLFIVLSSFHFGEQHFSKKTIKHNKIVNLFYSVYGLIIFLLIFTFHNNEVISIFKKININFINSHIINTLLTCMFTIMFGLTIYVIKNKLVKVNYIKELFLMLVFIVIFKNATLLWSFSIYFIIWHSLPSLNDQIKILYGQNNKKNILKYFKSSFIYWLISVLIIFFLIAFFKDDDALFNYIIIASLTSITCPHIFIMNKVLKEKS